MAINKETYAPDGPVQPAPEQLQTFWKLAKDAGNLEELGDVFQVRWIGLDADTTSQIIGLIIAGDKTGTFTLPWVVEQTGQPEPTVGDFIILIDFEGVPALVVRLTEIEVVSFADITEQHTAIDGPPVRDLNVWKPMHTDYWNRMLAPFGLSVSDEMPVLVEKFELIYPA